MPQKIYKTGIYARLSKEDADSIESNSIQSQRAICLAYIESHEDLELVDTYIDDGRTGSNTDRPGFQKMLEDMRSGRIDCAVKGFPAWGSYVGLFFMPVLVKNSSTTPFMVKKSPSP